MTTVAQYLAALPAERRAVLRAVRAVVRRHLDRGFQEGMQYGMIGYFVPHRVFPAGYHCDPQQPLPFAALAANKHEYALYLMCTYAKPKLREWFESAWRARGKPLRAGKSCYRFRRVDDVPLDVVAELLERVTAADYVATYQRQLTRQREKRSTRPAESLPNTTSARPSKPPAAKPAAVKRAVGGQRTASGAARNVSGRSKSR